MHTFENCKNHSDLSQAMNLHKAGRLAEAGMLYQSILEQAPDNAEVMHLLGTVLVKTSRAGVGASLIGKALTLNPKLRNGYYNLGAAWLAAGRPSLAEQACRKSLQLDGPDADTFLNLGNALSNQGRPLEALACFRKARKLAPENAPVVSAYLMGLQYVPGQNDMALHEAHVQTAREWTEREGQGFLVEEGRPSSTDDASLRIGFVSPDFRQHPVGFFLSSYFAGRRSGNCFVICYSDVERDDAVTRRLRETSDCWRNTSKIGNGDLLNAIRQDGIHILVDLAGYTQGNRFPLFARGAAPVQVAWAGYPGTTGLKNIDYLLTDGKETPPGSDAYFTEALAILPDGYISYAHPDYLPNVGQLPALGNGFVTLGACNGMPKINRDVLMLWAEVAGAIPRSRLLLANTQMHDSGMRDRIYKHFRDAGIAGTRIDLQGGRPHHEFLSVYNSMDVSLDTFPYSGGLTTLESLTMGVPVTAMASATFAGRHSSSHLAMVGLSDWIASSPAEYIAIAVKAVSDLDALAELRANLRRRVLGSPLCNGRRFADHLEAAFKIMWRQHKQGVRGSFHLLG